MLELEPSLDSCITRVSPISGVSHVPTVRSQRRVAEHQARIEKLAFRFCFVANAILLGTLLGLMAVRL